MTTRSGNKKAAWLLVALTPLIAELALGSTPITLAWLVILWVPVYGAGVLLIRELVCRTGRGWPSLILLGVAYELLEDGIGLQALTSPNLYDASQWGLRIFGFNLPYWEANALYHVVFTVLIPIALVDLIFPAHRGRPYLRSRTALVFVAVVTVLGTATLRLTVPLSQDPGYQAPVPFVIGCAVLIAVLGIVALRMLPRREENTGGHVSGGPGTESTLASLWWWRIGAGLVTVAVFFLTFPTFGAGQPAFTSGVFVVIPMIGALLLGAGSLIVLSRALRSGGWTDRHTLAVIAGALVAHTLAGMAFIQPEVINLAGLAVIAVVTVLAMAGLDRRLKGRSGPIRRR